MRGATAYQVIYADGAKKISTHAPLAGRDPAKIAVGIIFEISTHAPLAGRDISNLRIYDTPRISTHAPLGGRDGGILGAARAVCAHFNPRAPCGARLSTPPIPHRSYQFQPTRPLRGATCLMLFPCKIELVFQPTRPLRGATAVNRCRRRAYQNFNPRAPCGARRRWKDRKLRRADISTHAPLAGRDGGGKTSSCGELIFQPTRPLRGATTVQVDTMDMQQDFNPRAPCGARQQERFELYLIRDFNPRAPCGARRDQARDATGNAISTHAPLAGRDIVRSTAAIRVKNFNPRAPCGARPQQNEPRMSDLKISTHAPLAGRDLFRQDAVEKGRISTHAPLAGRDLAGYDALSARNRISTHAPLAGRDHVQQEER